MDTTPPPTEDQGVHVKRGVVQPPHPADTDHVKATHYHVLQVTKLWQQFRDDMLEHTTRTAAERARRDAQRHDEAVYREDHEAS